MVAGGEAIIPQEKEKEAPTAQTSLGPIFAQKTYKRQRKNVRPIEALVPLETNKVTFEMSSNNRGLY